MPMPMPHDSESHQEFMDRCMAHPTMMGDFPDAPQREAVCQKQWDGRSRSRRATGDTGLHQAGKAHALQRIRAGDVNDSADWSFSAADGDAILGDPPDWARYGSWHLGKVSGADPETKSAWKYPFGKDGNVYRSALRAIRTRAAQQNDASISDAAGACMDEMDQMAEGKSLAPHGVERRVATGLEIRLGDGRPARLVGYASVFNSKSLDLGGFVEIVRPGAFSRSLRGADIRALVEHMPGAIIGRTKPGTLTVAEDDRGLRVEITPPETQAGRDVVESVRRGDLDGMSFGFVTRKDRWTFNEQPEPALRELLDVDLLDVSVVAFPAYPKTEVALRSLEAARVQQGDLRLETARRRVRLADLERKA